MNVSISVEESLRNQVADLAAREERSFSSMFSVLAQRALDFSPEKTLPVRMLEPEIPVSPAKSPAKTASVLGKRTKKCIHLIEPDCFCKFGCDKP